MRGKVNMHEVADRREVYCVATGLLNQLSCPYEPADVLDVAGWLTGEKNSQGWSLVDDDEYAMGGSDAEDGS